MEHQGMYMKWLETQVNELTEKAATQAEQIQRLNRQLGEARRKTPKQQTTKPDIAGVSSTTGAVQ